MKNLPKEADAAIVTGFHNRRYLTQLRSSAGTLLITKNMARYIIDSRYYEIAKKTLLCDVVLQDKLYGQIADFLKENGALSAAIESDVCTIDDLSQYRKNLCGFEILDSDALSKQIRKQRERKSPQELAIIGKAQELTDRVFSQILGYLRPGITELEIALEIELIGRRMSGGEAAFPFIVACGKNTSMPHAVPGNNVLQDGDLLTLDFGFKVEDYCSDMTRTVAIGKPSDRQREVYNVVLRAQHAALDKIRPGAMCSDIDSIARALIDGTEFAGLFGHGLGHGIGLEVHESPQFSRVCETKLEPGMVLSVEPGIYIPGEFGVRIEDVVAITEDGFINLTHSPKDITII